MSKSNLHIKKYRRYHFISGIKVFSIDMYILDIVDGGIICKQTSWKLIQCICEEPFKSTYSLTQQFHFQASAKEKQKDIHTNTSKKIFVEALVRAPNQKQPKYPSVGKCLTKCDIFIQWNTIQQLKRRYYICYNMDEP